MGNSISIEKNRIIINEENLDTLLAMRLMQKTFDMRPENEARLVVDLEKVEHLSRSGLMVLSRLMEEVEGVELAGMHGSVARDLSCLKGNRGFIKF